MIMKLNVQEKTEYTATRNACKLCSPLGACFVFRGIKKSMPLLHGSQGCSTYIRRYLISHFNEPVDIASSNFTEETAVFGGAANLFLAIDNIIKQYEPEFIGIATTCLSETIGDDVPLILRKYSNKCTKSPVIVSVSTPSYSETHIKGFHDSVKAVVSAVARRDITDADHINIFPGMLSPADFRHIKEIFTDFKADYIMLPDYSETLDGPCWSHYQKIPDGGTSIKDIENMGSSLASIEFGKILAEDKSAGKLLEEQFKVPCYSLGIPIGINETDAFFSALKDITQKPVPKKYIKERARLIDAYADGHKYVFEKRAVVYGEEDLVVGLCSFLTEIGVIPVVCASGGKSGNLRKKLVEILPHSQLADIKIIEGADFIEIGKQAKEMDPDFLIGNSKGYKIARELKKPLIRAGFPIHDRLGGARILHVGYKGAQQLFDAVSNTIIASAQDSSNVGYMYM